MKRYILTIFIACLSLWAMAANTISLSSVSGTPQTEVEVAVSLDNSDAISALEITIPLSEHLQYVANSATLSSNRSNGHQITAAQVGQELRIYVYNMTLHPLQGNSGELLRFRLLLGNEPGEYTLSPVVMLSDAQITELPCATQNGLVTILAPKLQIVNEQIDFGHIPIRSTYTQTLELWNSGSLPLVISNIAVDDAHITPQQTALTIEPYATAYVDLVYAPVNRGAISRTLTITSNDPNGQQQVTVVADPFSVNELHVGHASGIADSTVTIALTMNNMEPIVAMQCEFVLPEELEYVANSMVVNAERSNGHHVLSHMQGNTLVLAIYSMSNQSLKGNDGEIATFELRLNGSSGTYYLYPTEVILSNSTQENMTSATSDGYVEIQSPHFSGDDNLYFGEQAITENITAPYRISNYGGAPLQIERTNFLAEGFSVVESLPLTINPWEEKVITVAYQPSGEGEFSTTMNLYTNDPNNRLKTVAISGRVYEPNTLSVEGEIAADGNYILSVSLNNYTDVVALQYDIHTPEGITTSQSAFAPTSRMQGHSYVVSNLGNNTYRVVIYSMSNRPFVGNEGVLHQLVFTPQGDNAYCDKALTFDEIMLSSAGAQDKVSQSTISYALPQTKYNELSHTACDQYIWNGEVYTESGTYTQTLQTVAGCDSIVTLHLTINHSEREEYYATACDEYWWHGQVYSESGDYMYSSALWNGCERIEVLHLTINKRDTLHYYEVACDEYYWNHSGNTYYDSGTYEYRTTTDQGCERLEILHLTINRSEREEYYETACDSYEWHGNTYYNSGTYEYHTTTAEGCERVEVLHLTIHHSEYEEYYVTVCKSYEWHGEVYYEAGDYTYETTTAHGCPRTEVLHLTLSDIEHEEFNVSACEEYWWHDTQYTESGDYEYNTTTDEGCERLEILHLTINRSEREEFNVSACEEYWWHDNQYTESGTYEYHTTTDQGCERLEVLHLTIHRSEREEYWETACDEYEWHGTTYYTSGTYEHHTTTAEGCYRLEVLHLTINRSEREEFNATSCDSYEWHGEVYTESGDYEYRTTTAEGCERLEILHLTIHHSEREEFNVSACESYEWHGTTYFESGTYEYYTTTDTGCERVEVLHLTIHHSEREEYYLTTCNQYEWHGQVYTEPGDYEYYTTTEYGCERVEVLHLSFSDREYEEYYETACDQYEWHGEVYTESGDYTFNTISSSGCERTEVLHLTIFYSEHEEYNVTACDSYEWHGETYTESGDYEYRTTITHVAEKLYVGYNAQNDPIVGLTPPRGISRFTVDGYITQGAGTCFVGTGTPADEEADNSDLRIFDAGCLYYDRMSGRNSCFFYDFREPFNIEFGNYYAKNLETGEYYFNEGNNVYEYSNTEYPLTLFYNDYGKIHKVQFFDNNNLLWADINAVIEGGLPMIKIDYYEADGTIYHTQQFTENLHAETKTITEQGCERVEVLHLTINRSEYEEYWETACDSYEWHGEVYTESGDYEYYTTNEYGCKRVEVLHLTINRSEYEEYWETACDSYEWYGQVYTASGDYEYRTTTAEGCERLEVLHLTINRSEYEEYYKTACDEYWWHNNQYTESGDYTYSYPLYDWGTGTCDRTEVLHLTINKRDTVHYYETACDEYFCDRDGNTYYDSGDYEHYTTTEQGCPRTEVLHLTINSSEREEYWETACDSYEWHGAVYTESGNYEYRTTTAEGCERLEILHLTINKSEREEYYETACDEYWWWRDGNTYYESGTYEYYTTTDQGCERVEILHLTINRSEREEYYENACDAYEWHGQYYYESGDYEYYTTTDQGCERIEVLHLTIYNSQYEDYWVTACDEYWWNDNQYTESGDYEYHTTLENGCQRVEVLHLTINHSEREEYYETACDEYWWHDTQYTESGDYEYYTTTEQGCGRIEVLHLTINRSEREEYYETACDEFYWDRNGETYYESGDYTFNTTTEQGCERVEILHLSINRSEHDEYWETACDSYEWHGQVYTESGDYEYRTTTEHGCERVEILHLSINKSEREEYTATACDQYEWYGQVYTESGDYEYRTTTEQGCERIEVLHLTINRSEREEYYETACDSYEWNGVVYTESGDYTYNTTTADGCERIEVLHLTILPEATIESEELALCPSELPYEWYGQLLTEEGTYSATEPYVGMECDSVIHELTLNVYVQTLPATVTLPIVRTGEAIDATIPTAEIQAHIAAETWYAPNALVAWYIMENSDWAALSADPVAVGITEVTLKYAVETDCGNVESDKMVIAVETTGLENIPTDVMGVYKVLRDNKIFIIRGGKAYSIMGHLVGDKSVIDPVVTIQ